MLFCQVEHDEPLLRDVEHMKPDKGVVHSSCSRVLDALAFVGWKCGLMRLEGGANPILQGRIHQQADGYHPQQRHEAFGLVERAWGGQQWWGFQEAPPRSAWA